MLACKNSTYQPDANGFAWVAIDLFKFCFFFPIQKQKQKQNLFFAFVFRKLMPFMPYHTHFIVSTSYKNIWYLTNFNNLSSCEFWASQSNWMRFEFSWQHFGTVWSNFDTENHIEWYLKNATFLFCFRLAKKGIFGIWKSCDFGILFSERVKKNSFCSSVDKESFKPSLLFCINYRHSKQKIQLFSFSFFFVLFSKQWYKHFEQGYFFLLLWTADVLFLLSTKYVNSC